ncbi:hypothetical protein AK812_SmicGene22619 [Symbiodinium microadriaticum]|uniref:BTB domain-containing protein n=1 Tax=Symbiodinium microadriaticum TaxID=2951 RepID=A0A1Q9DJB5_SYMMI|nr:hypothetical protein AK812_SmicGene22619 [Symbiodinium microadriaticum]
MPSMPSLLSSSSTPTDPPQEPAPTTFPLVKAPVPEVEYRFPAYLPRVWQVIDIVSRKDKYKQNEGFFTRDAGGSDSFRLKCFIMPKECSHLTVRVEVHPPEYMKAPKSYWIVEEVEWEICMYNFPKITEPGRGLFWSATEHFQTSDDPHYVDLVRTADLTRDKCWLDEKGQFHLRIRALLPVDDDKIVQTTKGLDLSQELETVTFHLPEEKKLYVDKRMLVARSEYFRNMLGTDTYKEGQTNQVDLTTDPQVDPSSLNGVLIYVMTGGFTCDGDTAYAFRVRKLADRFVLQGLCDLVDAELETMLCYDNVLDFLGEVAGTEGRLESACLGMLADDNCELIEVQQDKARNMMRSNAMLAEVLFQVLLIHKQKYRFEIESVASVTRDAGTTATPGQALNGITKHRSERGRGKGGLF